MLNIKVTVASAKPAEIVEISEDGLRNALKVIHASGFVICLASEMSEDLDAVACEDTVVEAVKGKAAK